MLEKYFFEIPIYTMKSSEYMKLRQKNMEKLYSRYIPAKHLGIDEFESIFQENLWRPWEYNQVIGWIALFIFGKDVRGDYYLAKSKRLNYRLVKKRFEYMGKAFECGFYQPCESEEIFYRLRERILSCKNDFNGKVHIELSTFDNLGPFIKWDSLLGY